MDERYYTIKKKIEDSFVYESIKPMLREVCFTNIICSQNSLTFTELMLTKHTWHKLFDTSDIYNLCFNKLKDSLLAPTNRNNCFKVRNLFNARK